MPAALEVGQDTCIRAFARVETLTLLSMRWIIRRLLADVDNIRRSQSLHLAPCRGESIQRSGRGARETSLLTLKSTAMELIPSRDIVIFRVFLSSRAMEHQSAPCRASVAVLPTHIFLFLNHVRCNLDAHLLPGPFFELGQGSKQVHCGRRHVR